MSSDVRDETFKNLHLVEQEEQAALCFHGTRQATPPSALYLLSDLWAMAAPTSNRSGSADALSASREETD